MGIQHMPSEAPNAMASTNAGCKSGDSAEPLATPVDESDVSPFGTEVPIESLEEDDDIKLLEKEKLGKTPRELLDAALEWKAVGNEKFKQKLNEAATDAYFRGIVFARDLVKNPKLNPDLPQTHEEHLEARQLCEVMFTNLSLAQIKYVEELTGDKAPQVDQDSQAVEFSPKIVLEEAARSAEEALKLNAKSDKALYRRALACSRVAQYYATEEALGVLARSRDDFLALLDRNAHNGEARTEFQKVKAQLTKLKKEQTAKEKKVFSFGSALGAIDTKPENVGGGTKKVLKSGDGGHWFDDEWLKPSWPRRCVVSVLKDDQPLSFTLTDDQLSQCVRSMTPNEEASFVYQKHEFKLQFMRYEIYAVQPRGLEKIFEEGYGDAPVPLADVAAHFRVISNTGTLLFDSRWRCNMSGGVEFMKKEADPDKPPISWIWGESCPWEPLEFPLLKQGGKSELRLAEKPPLLDVNRIFAAGSKESAIVGMDLKRGAPWDAGVIVFLELLRVFLPVESATDAGFCDGTIAREEVAAAMLVEKNELLLAERRFRRAIKFAQEVDKTPSEATRLGLANTLLRMALPVLDGGNVTSQELKTAQARLEEATSFVNLDSEANSAVANVCRARLRIYDDDFEQALQYCNLALKLDADYADAQALFRYCKEQRYRMEQERIATEIAKAQQLLRNSNSEEGLRCLELLENITWDAIMSTKIGVEVKTLMSHSEVGIRKRAEQLLGRWQDVSKQDRPMW